MWVASNGGKYVEELQQAGIEHIWAPLNNKKISNMVKAYRILAQIIREKNIELVHSHTRISSFLCGLLYKKMHFPFVTTAHWTFKVTPLLKMMTNWGEETIAVSNDIKEYLMKNYNIPEEKIIVTVNGIDTEKFCKNIDTQAITQEFHLQENNNRIVYISRLDESRALVAKQLVNIAENLNEKINNLEIVIVGGGDVFDEIQAQANRVNEKLKRQLIVMTGARTDINLFAALGDIFIGVSRSALEAMACERPVIVAGNEGYLGIFEEGKLKQGIETNFCCRGLAMSTEEQLEKDIITLWKAENKEIQGAYNRTVVKKYYSVTKMADDCERAYQAVLKR